jgi:hypothetical protein
MLIVEVLAFVMVVDGCCWRASASFEVFLLAFYVDLDLGVLA